MCRAASRDGASRCGSVGRQPRYPLVVAVVHSQDVVEPVEILLADRSGAVGQPVTACSGGRPHARIGQLAPMSGIGAGGIYLEKSLLAPLFDQPAEDAFGGR